ncbi:MAG: hypothetical protein NTX91_05085 [candidate division SR1 bacterium]|nr:hypothetical protein [candidate division SR1 bacterium]
MTLNTVETNDTDAKETKVILIDETKENITSNLSLQENEDEENYILGLS